MKNLKKLSFQTVNGDLWTKFPKRKHPIDKLAIILYIYFTYYVKILFENFEDFKNLS